MHDHFNMLIVDIHTLGTVHIMDALNDRNLGCARAKHFKDALRIHRTLNQRSTCTDMLAILNKERHTACHLILKVFIAFIRGDRNSTAPLIIFDMYGTIHIADRRLALRRAGFKKLSNTRKALSDIRC